MILLRHRSHRGSDFTLLMKNSSPTISSARSWASLFDSMRSLKSIFIGLNLGIFQLALNHGQFIRRIRFGVCLWGLGLSKLKSRDLEWYFFTSLDRKYGNGSRTNRATGEGYWKTTGKDRPVHHRSQVVGMKKTLVYHQGRAPRGKRTNWVMHEYKLVDEVLEKDGLPVEGYVLCRIFQKSGPGPKNGEQYGAPFAEEEWEKEDVEVAVPGEVAFEEPFAEEDSYIEQNDLEQNLDWQLPAIVPVPENLYHADNNLYCEDNSINVENSGDIAGSDNCFAGECEYNGDMHFLGSQQFFNLPVQGVNTADFVRNEHMVQPNVLTDGASVNCLPNESGLDIAVNELFDDGLYLDAIDFMNPAEENPFADCEQFLGDDEIAQYLTFEPAPALMSSETNQSLSTQESPDDTTWQTPTANEPLPGPDNDCVASSSKQAFEVSKSTMSDSAIQYPHLTQGSRLLSNLPAPPAFASELPSKDMAARLSAAVQSSSSVSVTAGMIRIRDLTVGGGSRLRWSLDKMGNVNVLLSFDLPEDVSHTGLSSLSRIFSSKVTSTLSRGWLRSMLWVLVFAASFKIGSLIYAK